jgi:hypothetical protein
VGELKAQLVDIRKVGKLCYSLDSDTQLLFTSIYAMCFDLTILLLTGYKLFILNPFKMLDKCRLEKILFVDGLSFFIITFV